MKKTNILLFSAALISGAFLFSNLTDVSASGIATTHDAVTFLYTDTGKMVSNRALAPRTPWAVGETLNLSGVTYYQVATNEYVQSGDVDYADEPVKNDVTVSPLGLSAPVYNDQTNSDQQIIKYGSSYKVGRIIENEYGQYYYQVSSHGWVVGDMMDIKGNAKNIEHINGFFPIANDYNGINPDSEYDILVSLGADPELVSEIPDEVLQYVGTVDNELGGDVGTNYRRMSQLYQLQY
ncbi:SLAP domain-containing protein [Companilactobacillus huachuanensis]|uniref:SLAP domain-containing protein n=1 Tax=Companilactobacillus huachuanensis TaxID=2559914 RepID=A0ABW1RPE2_9LACO|nr:SLAP domain-containing protein [Companilactobacillus huachuanensis]